METECRYRIAGSWLWLNDRLVEVESPIMMVTLCWGPYVGAVLTCQNGSEYDIDPQGTVFRVRPQHPAYPATAGLGADLAISVEGQALMVGDRLVKLTGPFYQIALVGDIIIVVVRARCDEDLNMIYGVDQTGEVVWRIQTPDYAEKIGGVEPYAGVSLRDGRLVARDVLGRLFAVDPKTGHIIGGMLGVTR